MTDKTKKDTAKDTQNREHEYQSSFDVTTLMANSAKHTTIPDTKVKARDVFGIDLDWEIPAFSYEHPNVPEIDKAYKFDHDTTVAVAPVNRPISNRWPRA